MNVISLDSTLKESWQQWSSLVTWILYIVILSIRLIRAMKGCKECWLQLKMQPKTWLNVGQTPCVPRLLTVHLYNLLPPLPQPKKQNKRKTPQKNITRKVVKVINNDPLKRTFFIGLDLFAENVSKSWDIRNNLGVTKGLSLWSYSAQLFLTVKSY